MKQPSDRVPSIGPDDVLIKIHRTAICGTDLHIYKWDAWAAATIPVPMIVGHEYAGEIVQIGARVTRKLHVGQRVSVEGHIIDINSAAARAGQFHLDPATVGEDLSIGVDITVWGQRVVAIALGAQDETTSIHLLDFNPHAVQRCRRRQHEGAGSGSELSAIRVVEPDCEECYFPGLTDSVSSRVPYVQTVSREKFNYDAVMINNHGIIGVKVRAFLVLFGCVAPFQLTPKPLQAEDDGTISSLEILHFG